MIDERAQRLRNTRSVCRQGNIHLAVIEAGQEGMDSGDSPVLRWLSRQG